MGRLKGIPKILSPDLLHALASMGHGDEIVLADANFPARYLFYNFLVFFLKAVDLFLINMLYIKTKVP